MFSVVIFSRQVHGQGSRGGGTASAYMLQYVRDRDEGEKPAAEVKEVKEVKAKERKQEVRASAQASPVRVGSLGKMPSLVECVPSRLGVGK